VRQVDRVVAEHDRDRRGEREHGEAEQQPPGAAAHVGPGPPGERRQPGREQRQQQVERGLHAQAPHLRQALRPEPRPPRVRVVGLGEGEQDEPGAGVAEPVARPQRERRGHHQPVRGQDAQRPPYQVGAGVRGGPAGERGGRPRAVEQQPGEREEDRHGDVAAGEQPGEEVVAERGAGLDGDVEGEDRERGDRADAVERVDVRIGGGGAAGGAAPVTCSGHLLLSS